MNLRDRFLRTLKGETVDRVPLELDGFEAVSREYIHKSGDMLWKEIADRVYDKIHYYISAGSIVDPIDRFFMVNERHIKKAQVIQGDNTLTQMEIPTPKGMLTACTGFNSSSRTQWVLKHPVECMEDIEKIASLSWELPGHFKAPDLSKLPHDFSDRGVLKLTLSSPVVCVSGMMSYEYFLELCATNFELMKELTEISFEREMVILESVLKNKNVDMLWIGGCEWMTPPMASPKLYDELVHGYEDKMISRAHELGALCQVHCHGNISSTLEKIIERGGDYTEPVEPPPDGDIEFSEAKKLAAGRITLGGNIESRIIEGGSEKEIEEAVVKAFEGGKHRMILKPSAFPISKVSEQMYRNYNKMIDLWDEMSQYRALVRYGI